MESAARWRAGKGNAMTPKIALGRPMR